MNKQNLEEEGQDEENSRDPDRVIFDYLNKENFGK